MDDRLSLPGHTDEDDVRRQLASIGDAQKPVANTGEIIKAFEGPRSEAAAPEAQSVSLPAVLKQLASFDTQERVSEELRKLLLQNGVTNTPEGLVADFAHLFFRDREQLKALIANSNS